VADSCEYGDEPSGSGATELVVSYYVMCTSLYREIHFWVFFNFFRLGDT
jgi:hypothetical protein